MKTKLLKFSVILCISLMALSSCSNEDFNSGSFDNSENRTWFVVILKSPGPNKIAVMKLVKKLTVYKGLKEAKAIVDNAPSTLGIKQKDEAEQMKSAFEDEGAEIELK